MRSDRLREMRERSGLTQQDVARLLNVTRGAVGHWERGKNEPSFEMLRDLARLYNTSTAYLIGETDDPSPLEPKRQDRERSAEIEHPPGWELLTDAEKKIVDRISKDMERILVQEILRERNE